MTFNIPEWWECENCKFKTNEPAEVDEHETDNPGHVCVKIGV